MSEKADDRTSLTDIFDRFHRRGMFQELEDKLNLLSADLERFRARLLAVTRESTEQVLHLVDETRRDQRRPPGTDAPADQKKPA